MRKFIASLALALFIGSVAQAHFPWLTVDKDGNAAFFFGESIADTTYKLPPGIAKAELWMHMDGKSSKVETKAVETDDFVGKHSAGTVPAGACLTSECIFGVYHGAKLQYYTQHLGGKMPTSFKQCKPFKDLALQAHAVDTDGGVEVYVLWKGKPLADAKVVLYCDSGHEEGEAKTDAEGKVSFNDKQVEDGINGIMVGHTITGETGKVGDQEYKAAMHYLTATFYDPEDK